MFSTIAAAPAKQSASETISVLSGRLTATLLEDRRAAILGLRSFAKEYPASVASGALRGLIGSLSKDGEDIDTVKVVFETLLMLFSPNEDSPEASEEIALWLADEFTQRQENITLLLDFLDTNDFYSRLYSLQLLSAILSARTERTEECVYTAPLGISRLVTVLDDSREAIRNEGISLLTYLTSASIDIQKSLAFENAFPRVFKIIVEEGGLLEGARVVEDCLILLANLLRLNSSNQSMFRDMGFIAHLGRLLESAYKGQQDGEEIAIWALAQRNRNIYALLAVIRLFLVPGAVGTSQNQQQFLKDHVLENALLLAFTREAEIPIRSEALATCADMIRGNDRLQESFAGLQVPSPLTPTSEGPRPQANGVQKIFAIEGLLDLTLAVHDLPSFDMRMAACACLKAYFCNHDDIRKHFLTRAVDGHKPGARDHINILSALLNLPDEKAATDPYRLWFASVLMLHLVYENPATKALAMGVTEGDESSGEEVVTCIQTITARFLGSVARAEDVRISIGYLMLLLCWLFEDMDGVNDFLGEGSHVQGMIQAAVENPAGDPIVQGLSAMLLGVIYEFSTKDSPVPRTQLREIIMSRMGRDRYVDKMSRLRSHPLMRDFEVTPQKLDLSVDQKFPDVFFDETFVEFFKDNYSRILRAIDREPGMEISVITNGVQKGISREMVDGLKDQLEKKDRALQEAEAALASLSSQLGQERADHKRVKETKDKKDAELARAMDSNDVLRKQIEDRIRDLQDRNEENVRLLKDLDQERAEVQRMSSEVSRLKTVNEGLQQHHRDEIASSQAKWRAQEQELQKQMEMRLESARKAAQSDAERLRRRSEAEQADLKATISRLEVDLMKANKLKSGLESKCAELEGKLTASTALVSQKEERIKALEVEAQQAQTGLREKDDEKKAVQEELDDLLMVFSDLEEKKNRYEERLKSLGESISDGEDEYEEETSDAD